MDRTSRIKGVVDRKKKTRKKKLQIMKSKSVICATLIESVLICGMHLDIHGKKQMNLKMLIRNIHGMMKTG